MSNLNNQPVKLELNNLINLYIFLINNYELFNQSFTLPEKYSRSMLKLNLNNLIEFREFLNSKNFTEAEIRYSEITLIADQKSILRDAMSFYKKNPDCSYNYSSDINLSNLTESMNKSDEFITHLEKQNSILQQYMAQEIIPMLKTQEENTKNLQDSIINSEILTNIQDQLLELKETLSDNPNLQNNLNTTIKSLFSESILEKELVPFKEAIAMPIIDLKSSITAATNNIKHSQKISEELINQTTSVIIESQNKIFPNLHKALAEIFKVELQNFFNSIKTLIVKNETNLLKSNKTHIRRLSIFVIIILAMVIICSISSSFFSAKLTTKYLYEILNTGK